MDTLAPGTLRHFAFTLAGILLALFSLVPWVRSGAAPVWPWAVALALAVPAVVAPASLGPLYWAWMWLGEKLGWVNTRLILGVFFVVVLVPVALLVRLLGKDALRRRFDPAAASYRLPSTPRPARSMEGPF